MKTNKTTQTLALLAGAAVFAGTQMSASAQTLLNRWSFNETSGITAVDSVGSQNGTLQGTATFNGTGQAVLDGTGGTYMSI